MLIHSSQAVFSNRVHPGVLEAVGPLGEHQPLQLEAIVIRTEAALRFSIWTVNWQPELSQEGRQGPSVLY